MVLACNAHVGIHAAHPHRTVPHQGTTFVNQYIVIKPLGHGAHGTVKLALNMHNDKLFAIKLVPKPRTNRRFVWRCLARIFHQQPITLVHLHLHAVVLASTKQLLVVGRPSNHGDDDHNLACDNRRQRSSAALDASSGEIALLKKLAHPNIVRLREVIDDPKADKVRVQSGACMRVCVYVQVYACMCKCMCVCAKCVRGCASVCVYE